MTQPTLSLDRDDLHLILEAIITRRQHLRSVIKTVDEAEDRANTESLWAELGGLHGMMDRVLEALYPLTKV
jgi:hypothetical protein